MAWDDTPPQASPTDGGTTSWDAIPPTSAPESGIQRFMSVISPAAHAVLAKPLDAIKNHLLNIGKGVAATASLPYKAAGAGIDAATGIPGFAQNVDVFPQLGAASPSLQTAAGNQITALAGEALPKVGEAAVNAVTGGVKSVGDHLQWMADLWHAPQKAEDAIALAKDALGTTEALSTTGGAVKMGLTTEATNMKTLKNALYKAVPDVNIPTDGLAKEAENIILEQSKLPSVHQNPAILKMANSYANELQDPSFQVLNKVRSDLGDMVVNGTGTDKMYAGRLLSALKSDIKTFAAGGNPLSQAVGQQFADTFSKATAYNKAVAELQSSPLVRKLQNTAIEDLPNAIFKKGNVDDILTARAAIGDTGFQAAKQAFSNDLLGVGNISKAINKYEPAFLKAVYNSDELSLIQGAAKLQDAAMKSAKLGTVGKVIGAGTAAEAINLWLMHKLFH